MRRPGPRAARPCSFATATLTFPASPASAPPFSRILYINDALRPQQFQARQACLTLDPDTIYLIVPGAFTLEEDHYPAFSFAVLDLAASRVVMVSLRDLAALDTMALFPD